MTHITCVRESVCVCVCVCVCACVCDICVTHSNESCHINTHSHESCHINIYVTHSNESCHINMCVCVRYLCDMTHSTHSSVTHSSV